MSVNLSIKDVPDDLARLLRERAERHHRSLQGELMSILTQAVQAPADTLGGSARTGAPPAGTPSASGAPREWMEGWKTIEHLAAERRAAAWKPDPSLANLPLAVDIIRADRDSR